MARSEFDSFYGQLAKQAVLRDLLIVAGVLGMHTVLMQRCGGALGAIPTIGACLYPLMRPRPPICRCWMA